MAHRVNDNYHLGGRVKTDAVTMAAAQQEQAVVEISQSAEEATPQRHLQIDPRALCFPLTGALPGYQPQFPGPWPPKNASVQKQDSATAVPRRRGRPLKAKLRGPPTESENPTIPRRRGRPPLPIPLESENLIVPRRRGRPPLPMPLESENPTIPRRRGRPPLPIPPESENPTIPRRRGRPPLPMPLESENPTIPRHRGWPPLSIGLPTDQDSPLESKNPTIPRRGQPPLTIGLPTDQDSLESENPVTPSKPETASPF
jgi:hypothetical protein